MKALGQGGGDPRKCVMIALIVNVNWIYCSNNRNNLLLLEGFLLLAAYRNNAFSLGELEWSNQGWSSQDIQTFLPTFFGPFGHSWVYSSATPDWYLKQFLTFEYCCPFLLSVIVELNSLFFIPQKKELRHFTVAARFFLYCVFLYALFSKYFYYEVFFQHLL